MGQCHQINNETNTQEVVVSMPNHIKEPQENDTHLTQNDKIDCQQETPMVSESYIKGSRTSSFEMSSRIGGQNRIIFESHASKKFENPEISGSGRTLEEKSGECEVEEMRNNCLLSSPQVHLKRDQKERPIFYSGVV